MQSAILGNGLVLQNLLHMQMAQQQLLQIKDKHVSNVRVCVYLCLSVLCAHYQNITPSVCDLSSFCEDILGLH